MERGRLLLLKGHDCALRMTVLFVFCCMFEEIKFQISSLSFKPYLYKMHIQDGTYKVTEEQQTQQTKKRQVLTSESQGFRIIGKQRLLNARCVNVQVSHSAFSVPVLWKGGVPVPSDLGGSRLPSGRRSNGPREG